MKNAFTNGFPKEKTTSSVAVSGKETIEPDTSLHVLEEDDLWKDCKEEISYINIPENQRLSCFAHSLRLAINIGVAKAHNITNSLARVTKFSSLPTLQHLQR